MDEETIKQYQDLYNFKNEDITWANTANNNFFKLPKKGKTYFFVQSDGSIYIGTVLEKKGVNVYKTRIEKNINNKLEVEESKESNIYIDYKNPENNMIMWAEIIGYDSIDDLLDDFNMISVNNNSSRGPYAKKDRTTNITTGRRFGGKGRKKTKKNKNKKRKTHRKR